MSTPMMLAIGLTRWWVRLYTKGLPPEMRDARRAEIESDLWEQGEDATANGSQPDETALQVFVRLLLGTPADLTWRLEQRGAGRRTGDRSITMNESPTTRALVLLGTAVAAFPIVIGFLVLVGLNGDLNSAERIIFGLLQMVVGSAIVAGLLVSARRPVLGISLVGAGAIAVSAIWYWAVVITIPVGIALAAIAYFRARRFAGERDRIAPA